MTTPETITHLDHLRHYSPHLDQPQKDALKQAAEVLRRLAERRLREKNDDRNR